MNTRLLSRVLCQPWAMRSLELSALTQLILATPDAQTSVDTKKLADNTRPKITSTAAAILPIFGVLGRGWDDFDKWYLGAVDVDDLIAEIDQIPDGASLVLWFRSPGGIITGIPEFSAYLRAEQRSGRIRILAYTDDLCCSAAYWLAAQCESIYASPTARIGSIGVYISFYDWTAYLEKAGIKLELFRAGRMKAMGLPGNPLSDEESAHIQDSVDDSYTLFTKEVTRNREIDGETMQGQTYSGKQAFERHLCDGFFASISECLNALAKGKI